MHHFSTARSCHFAKFAFATVCAFVLGLALVAPASFAADNGDPFMTADDLCQVALTPATNNVQVNGTHTLTATVSATDAPRTEVDYSWPCVPPVDEEVGAPEPPPGLGTIEFVALSGPNAGLHSTQKIDVETGQAQFTYTSTQAGTDNWIATAHLENVCYFNNTRLYEQTYNSETESFSRYVGAIPEGCVEDYCGQHYYDTDTTNGDSPGDVDDSHGCGAYLIVPTQAGNAGPPRTVQGSPQSIAIQPTASVKSNPSDITWFSPVKAEINPSVHVASNKKCHRARSFHIRSAGYNGTVASTTIYIDHKKYKVHHGSGKAVFTLLTRHYHPGKHNVKIVTTFTNGKTVTTATSFKRCPIKVARKSPRFTG